MSRCWESLATAPVFAVFSVFVWIGVYAFDFDTTMVWIGETVLFFLLTYAWYLQWGRLRIPVLYILTALFFFRMIYFMAEPFSAPWPLRSRVTLTPFLSGMMYLGIGSLHPHVYRWVQSLSNRIAFYSCNKRRMLLSTWLILLGIGLYMFQSVHITRDGFDWIQRTTEPVWHLYLREPLTIALYRWVYLAGDSVIDLSARNAIALVSVFFGLLGMTAYHHFLRAAFTDPFERIVGWFLLLSFGGLFVLFFGHIEVYPVLAGCLLCTFYGLQQYLSRHWSVIPFGVMFAVTSVIHLSAGWLVPVLMLAPLFSNKESKYKDLIVLWVVYSLFQLFFWGGLIFWKYDANLPAFLARLHQTFNVGLDRAMFLPPSEWLTSSHLSDWLAVYAYLMPGALMLFPLAIARLFQSRPGTEWIWIGCFAGYFVYTFCWNADRGYPEDWDLFSPVTVMTLPMLLYLLFERDTELHVDEVPALWVSVYLAAVGCIPFSMAQVWFHHTQRFALF